MELTITRIYEAFQFSHTLSQFIYDNKDELLGGPTLLDVTNISKRDSLQYTDAMEAWIKDLNHRDQTIRAAAVFSLATLEDTVVIPLLLKVLSEDVSLKVRRLAAEILARIGSPVVPSLLQTLRSDSGLVRKLAIETLGKIGKHTFVPKEPLIDMLQDDHYRVRTAAVTALAEIADARVVPALLYMIHTTELPVFEIIVDALKKIGTPAIPYLIDTLQADNAPTKVREAAVLALGGYRDDEAIAVLIQALQEDENIEDRAIQALVAIGEPAIEPLLEALKTSNEMMRTSVILTLAKIGESHVKNPLLKDGGL